MLTIQGEKWIWDMRWELLGLHEGCGGQVFLALTKDQGGRLCEFCGASGVNCLLMSEIFSSDDLTPVVRLPMPLEAKEQEIEIEITEG